MKLCVKQTRENTDRKCNLNDRKNTEMEIGSEPFLAGGVPNLGLDDLVIDFNAPGGELDSDCGLGFEAELVPREPRQEVRFPDTGVSDQHHLEQVIVIVVRPVRPHGVSAQITGFSRGCLAR